MPTTMTVVESLAQPEILVPSTTSIKDVGMEDVPVTEAERVPETLWVS
jgi:hypothetical protein